jgi:hypothetical protein
MGHSDGGVSPAGESFLPEPHLWIPSARGMGDLRSGRIPRLMPLKATTGPWMSASSAAVLTAGLWQEGDADVYAKTFDRDVGRSIAADGFRVHDQPK